MEITYVNQKEITCRIRAIGVCVPQVSTAGRFRSSMKNTSLPVGGPYALPDRLSIDCSNCLCEADSSGVNICNSIVNYLRHGNYICKSEGIYLQCERIGVVVHVDRRVLEPLFRTQPRQVITCKESFPCSSRTSKHYRSTKLNKHILQKKDKIIS